MSKLSRKPLIAITAIVGVVIIAIGVLILSGNLTNQKTNKTNSTINVGDYVKFGKYLNDPIVWKCISKDNNGIMLVSDYILCMKPFDAAESGNYSLDTKGIKKYGNNVWSSSNLREWLNSAATTVKYSTQPPVKLALWNGWNAYADEAGFLSNFTESERAKIQTVTHEKLTDSVYLLSDDEVNNYFGNSDALRIKAITKKGRTASEYVDTRKDKDANDNWFYWSRTPHKLQSEGGFGSTGASVDCAPDSGVGGVLPVLNLKSDTLFSGVGTMADPYSVN